MVAAKHVKHAFIILLVLSMLALLTGCPDYKDEDAVLVGNIKYCKTNDGKAIVYSAVWDGNPENTVFEIPDTYEGRPIFSLGGTVAGFMVETTDRYSYNSEQIWSKDSTQPESVDWNKVEHKDVVFTLKLGKNVTRIRSPYASPAPNYLVFKNDDGFILYRVLFNVECSKENEYYTSENGMLYRIVNHELENDLPYASAILKEPAE
jgi:hypothetical protein